LPADIQACFAQKDSYGYTPFMLAAAQGRDDIIQELLPSVYNNDSKITNPNKLELSEVHSATGFTPLDFLIYKRKLLNLEIKQQTPNAQRQTQYEKYGNAEDRLRKAGGISVMEQVKNEESLVNLANQGVIASLVMAPLTPSAPPPYSPRSRAVMFGPARTSERTAVTSSASAVSVSNMNNTI
jgi:ankyrin repeat protein